MANDSIIKQPADEVNYTIKEFRTSTLCPDSIIKTEGEDPNHHDAKIMIGD